MAQKEKTRRRRKTRRLVPIFLCVVAAFALLWAAASGLERLKEYSRSSTVRQVQPEPEPPEFEIPEQKPAQQDPNTPEDLPPNTFDPALFHEENGFLRYGSRENSRVGIDISSHQQDIDWEKVKAAGVDFAIIRLGYRGYTEGVIQPDECFIRNMDGAVAAGLDVGVYFFSQAVTPQEAVEEAQFCLQWLEDRKLQYPVLFDWEDIEAEARTDGMNSITLTACAEAFCRTVEAGGFRAGIYFNQTFGYQELNLPQLKDYCFWLAEYNDVPSFAYDFSLWQYRCDGSVDGINGNVDLNLAFIRG